MDNDHDTHTPPPETTPAFSPSTASGSPLIDRDAQRPEPPDVATSFPIVGIGASAGGLEAIMQLLRQLPADTGLAFILVQHLDPNRESILAEILSRATPMLVQAVQDGMTVYPNQVYVVPPQADLVITNRLLKLIPRPEVRRLHMPIDVFFRSLAEDQESLAIGIILSGAGSDGALGLQTIKEHGGLTFVQDERTATFPGMPHSAILQGTIDFIRTPDGIAQELLRLAKHSYIAITPPAHEKKRRSLSRDRDAWGRILTRLRETTGIDFTAYKPSTINRRITRRMALHNLEKLSAYAQYLNSHEDEVDILHRELLIKVTTFFRDPDSFEVLKREVLPRLLQERPLRGPVRIWVPGCATGEEAYSLAICVLEFLSDQGLQHTIRLFATDIDELALTKARTGLYLESIALDVSPERLQRFFVKVDRHYQINAAVRELCVFAKHNIYQDPPFSNLDLISCRNVLIYLEAATQGRVIPLFHYALQPDGVLTLGPSETIGAFTDLFAVTNYPHKIYTKKLAALPTAVDFPPQRGGGEAPISDPEHPPATFPPWPTFDVYRESDRVLLSQYAPAAVLVNAEMDILQFRGDTNRYLRSAQGKATLNLFQMARDGLLRGLRAALEPVQRTGVQVRQEGARVRIEQSWQEVTIRVIPITLPPPAPTASHYLVVFEEPAAPVLPAGAQPRHWRAPPPPAVSDPISQWDQELEAMRLYMQALMEQHEATTEEFTAANEEVISSNEELQSTNEELETAKEELQSMNEELLTTNDELRHRNLALSETNSDLSNLFSSVQLPIIMVDHDLRIRRFTAMAETILQLIPADTGRPIRQLQLNIALPELEALTLKVVTTGIAYDCEVQDRDGHWYSLRIRPYRTREGTIDGAVLVLIDIDSLKDVDRLTRLLQEVQRARQYAEAIVNTVRQPLVILDPQLNVRTANHAFYQTFGLTPEATEQHSLFDVGDRQWDLPRLREALEEIIPLNTEMHDLDVEYAFPTLGTRTLWLNARCLVQDDPSEALILVAIEDPIERSRAHDRLDASGE